NVHAVAAPQSRTILRNQSVVMNIVIKDLNPLSAHSNNSIIPWISENFIVLKDNIMYPGFVAFEFNTIDFNGGKIENQPFFNYESYVRTGVSRKMDTVRPARGFNARPFPRSRRHSYWRYGRPRRYDIEISFSVSAGVHQQGVPRLKPVETFLNPRAIPSSALAHMICCRIRRYGRCKKQDTRCKNKQISVFFHRLIFTHSLDILADQLIHRFAPFLGGSRELRITDPHRNTGRNGCPDHRRTAPVGDIGGDCLEGLVCRQSGRVKFVRIRRSANHCYSPVIDNSRLYCRLDSNPYARFGEEERWR